MGPDEDTTLLPEDREPGQPPGRRSRTRCCLLKGCERRFCPLRARQHYCSDECRQAARRWSRWKAQQNYRATAVGKERRNGQRRRYREWVRDRQAGGRFGYSGDGRPAVDAELNGPVAAAVDIAGNLYIAEAAQRDGSRIRKVSTAGIITTVAGIGSMGYSGDGGLAINAQRCIPNGVAVDEAGNLYIADTYNNRIRKVSQIGIITTVAGGTSSSDSLNLSGCIPLDLDCRFLWGWKTCNQCPVVFALRCSGRQIRGSLYCGQL